MVFQHLPDSINEMSTNITIAKAGSDNSREVAVMVGELLSEIMGATGEHAFNFDLEETTNRLADFLDGGKYFVFVARAERGGTVGFLTLYESYALYAEGSFGTIAELYVRPEYRSNKVGFHLVSEAKSFGLSKGWNRLEVTTPPLPQFDKTLAFYEREGFSIAGGRKLKAIL
ncbi:MAG: GNAT family N-acetyltransferase [Halothiobacillaceae bacterium]|nr:GNAT family N-acetyltransferase [Halothiobacillaceae bacterium]